MNYLSLAFYNGDGRTRAFTIPFPYLEELDVSLLVNGSVVPSTFANKTTIVASDAAPARGSLVQVKRKTLAEGNAARFEAAGIKAADLHLNFLQLLFLSQEAQEALTVPTGL